MRETLVEERELLKEPQAQRGQLVERSAIPMPRGMCYLVFAESLIICSGHGIQTVLALFFFDHLKRSERISTELVHVYTTVYGLAPVAGALLSDGYLGRYLSLRYLNILQLAGSGILILAAVPGLDIRMNFTLTVTAIGLVFTAVGFGGHKPCMAAFGGDQVEELVPDGPDRARLRRLFFSMYYISVNMGAFASSLVAPAIRALGYFVLLFSIQGATIFAAVVVIWLGRSHYVYRPVKNNVLVQVFSIILDAFKLRANKQILPVASSNMNESQSHLLGSEIGNADSNLYEGKYEWLDCSKLKHDASDVEEVKTLLGVLALLTPLPAFWALWQQQYSTWVFQAYSMNCELSWLGGLVLQPDQLHALNPILVLIMIPIFDQAIYPFFARLNFSLQPLRKMVIGMILSVLAFVVSGALQVAINNSLKETSPADFDTLIDDAHRVQTAVKLSVMWQLPQYLLITAAEILINVTGLEFAYAQAPPSMKTVIQSVWNCTGAFGNVLTFAVVALLGGRLSKANAFFSFAGGCAIATMLLVWISLGYNYTTGHPVAPSTTRTT